MKRYHQLLNYIGKSYSDFLFISVFYSLWIVLKYTSFFDPTLRSFPGRMIGEATLQGYDIHERVTAFYTAGALFLLGTILFSIIARQISIRSKDLFKTPEIKIINYTSLAGIILDFFLLYGSSINTSLELIYCIQKAVITVFILKRLLLKNNNNSRLIDIPVYALAFVIGVSVFFIWNETAVLFHIFPQADLLIILFVTVILFCLLLMRFVKQNDPLTAKRNIDRFTYLLMSLALIPLLSFFKDEIYLILNKHHVYFLTPWKLYIVGLFIILGRIVWLHFRIKKSGLSLTKNCSQLISSRYFPLLIIGIATYTFYNPFIQASTEMYEEGNRFLPIMEYQKFGVIPILEKFNAHQLFELFWGGIYVFFNGLSGREMVIYYFAEMVAWLFLTYLLIYKLSRNPYVALFVVLIFPLTAELIHQHHSAAFIAIFLLHALINRKASFKNYILLYACAAFLILWRMDIGYASVIAMAGTLFIYWLNEKRFVFDRKLFIKTILIFSSSVFLLLCIISWWRGVNIFSKLFNGFNYLASAQSYGFIDLGDASVSQFKMHYFVFPFVIILELCTLLVFFQPYTISRSQRFVYTTLVFLIIYYLVNFQRGLVAHTFATGSDGWLSPNLFFIFSASVYLFLYKRSQAIKFIIFITLSVFFIMNYKYSAVASPQNIYSRTAEKVKQFSVIEPRENIVRCINDIQPEDQKFGDFKKLISQLNEKQTFIDFSNTPMLYYLTGKISPSYFYQNPLTIHNDYLQTNFISELKNYDAPLIVFSHNPQIFWDAPFGVPNEIRHYRLAEYFYNNYQPFAMVDSLCIWKKNDFALTNNAKTVFSYESDTSATSGGFDVKTGKKYYFEVKYKNYNFPSFIKVRNTVSSKTLSSTLHNDQWHLNYFILDTAQEGCIKFSVANSNNPVEYFKIIECDYIPDFYSSQVKHFDLNQLPYIWGMYDKEVHQEKVIADLLFKPETITKDNIHYFNFSANVDKTSGNTILISLQCDNEIPVQVDLMYGTVGGAYEGGFSFSIPPGKGAREFAIRVSSQYNWYSKFVNYIALTFKDINAIEIDKMQLLKGN